MLGWQAQSDSGMQYMHLCAIFRSGNISSALLKECDMHFDAES